MSGSGKPPDFNFNDIGSKPTISPSMGKPHITTTPMSALPKGSYARGYIEHDPVVGVIYPSGKKDTLHGGHGLINMDLELERSLIESIHSGTLGKNALEPDNYLNSILRKLFEK